MIFVMLHYSLHTWLWKYSSRCNLSDWLLLIYCHLDKWNHPAVIISWSCRWMCCWFVSKTLSILESWKIWPTEPYPVHGMLGWWQCNFSAVSLAKVRGMQKNSCCLFLNSVHNLYHPLCVILPAPEMIKFPMRFTLWDICKLDSVAFTVCDIFHKIQSSMFCSALHSVFLIGFSSVSKCSLCFDV
jgi:hypothetical protein